MTDPQPIIDLIYAFRRSKAMFTAVSLGVFDRLEQAPAGPAAFPELNQDAIRGLLEACVALGLLTRDRDNLFHNTALAREYLCRSSPDTLAGYILYSDAALYPMWAGFDNAVREGTNRWQATFGFPATALFEHFFQTDRQKRDFLLGMHGFGRISSPKVARAFDLGRFRRLVDLGGATGHLALAAIEAWPQLSAAVFDLPAATGFAREFTGDRVDLIAGDFFADPLPPADLYVLGRILHDWTETRISGLLAKIFQALPAGGALLIAEILLDDDRLGPLDAHLQSLNMLVCTDGRERNLAEYRALLEAAGFTGVEGRRTGTPLDAVLALKP